MKQIHFLPSFFCLQNNPCGKCWESWVSAQLWSDWYSKVFLNTSVYSCMSFKNIQTEEQYVSQQGCQTHPSQMLRWNTRVWPRENNTAHKPLLNDPSGVKGYFCIPVWVFCIFVFIFLPVRIVCSILWIV